MEWFNLLVLILSFGILLFIGVPISFSLGFCTILTLIISVDPISALTTVAQRMGTGLDSFALLAIPFFILAGQFMNRGGIARRLVDFAKTIVYGLPGSLSFVIIVACMLFGAISGSAVAAAAAVGGFMIPLMVDEGYDRDFSAAVNVTASTTGILIPPSNVLIVYAFASGGASVAALFLAGYLPGILLGLCLMVVAGYYSYTRGYPKGDKVSYKEAFIRFLDSIPSILLIIIVIGGIVAGYFTATEASAVAVLYAFLLAVPIYGEVKWREIPDVLLQTSKTTAIVMFLIAASIAMSWMLSFEQIPQNISSAMLAVSDSKFVILLLMNVILLIVGTFMDVTPAILIFTPIFMPVVTELGVDPVHFGIIIVLNLCVGLCTPPVGTALFVGTSIADTTISKMVKPLLPLYAVMIFWLLVVTYVPELSLYLPRLFGF